MSKWRGYYSLQLVLSFGLTWLCPALFLSWHVLYQYCIPYVPGSPYRNPSAKCVLFWFFYYYYYSHWFLYESEIVQRKFSQELSLGILYPKKKKKKVLKVTCITWQNKFLGAIVRDQSPDLFKTQTDKVTLDMLTEIPYF